MIANHRVASLLVQLALTAAVCAFLLARVDFGLVLENLKNFRPLDYPVVLALFAGQCLVGAFRLKIILRYINSDCSFSATLKAILISAFFAQTPLSAVGGDAVKIWVLYKHNVKTGDAAISVALDRALGALALLLIIVVALPPLWQMIQSPSLRLGFIAVLVLGVFLGAALMLLTLIPEVFRRFRIIAWVQRLAHQFVRILSSPSMSFSLFGLSLATQSFSLLMILFIAHAIGVPASSWDILILAPFPLLASTLPISFGGWGPREGVMIVALGIVGVPPSQGLAVSVSYGIALMVGSLPGGLVWLLDRNSKLIRNDEIAPGSN